MKAAAGGGGIKENKEPKRGWKGGLCPAVEEEENQKVGALCCWLEEEKKMGERCRGWFGPERAAGFVLMRRRWESVWGLLEMMGAGNCELPLEARGKKMKAGGRGAAGFVEMELLGLGFIVFFLF
jgi:hypothetical protein